MGSGYKAFTAGEVLTASDVNNYLMEQSVMVFADSTARASTIGTANFEEGMVSYLEDSDTVEVYDGSAWGSIAPVSNQGITLINTTSFSAVASQSINSVFSSTYDAYRLVFTNMNGSGASQNIRFRLRKSGADNSSSIYYIQYFSVNNTSVSGARVSTATQWVIGDVRDQGPMSLTLDIFNPNNASVKTNCLTLDMQGSTSEPILYFAVQTHDLASSADFDGFTIFPASGTMSGMVSVYGYNK